MYITFTTSYQMKTRRNIYIGIGAFLIFLNVLLDIVELSEYRSSPGISPSSIGYFLGSHILAIFGLLLLRMAYKVNQRIRRKEENVLQNSIEAIGEK